MTGWMWQHWTRGAEGERWARTARCPARAALGLWGLWALLATAGCARSADSGLPPGVEIIAAEGPIPNTVRESMSLMEKGFSSDLDEALAQKRSLSGLHAAGDDAALAHPEARRSHATLGRAATGLGSARVVPPSWVQTATEGMARKRPHVAGERLWVQIGKGRLGYLQAIGVDASCARCHGPDEALHPAVRQWVQARYPEAKNGAFRVERLRGWYWIELDAPATP